MMRLLSSALFTCLVLLSSPLFAQLQEPSPPVNLIIDSDMAIDADDVGDHAMMWALANRGEVNVIALICSSANDYSAPAMRAIANYYGHSGVPLGAHKGNTPSVAGSNGSNYTFQIANQFGTPGDTRLNYPDAVTVYRQALANAADSSVYILANGYYQPLRDLLQSQPDSISPLTGIQLVAQKVKRLISSAGRFPSGTTGNFQFDPDAASYVFANWPVEITSVGNENADFVMTGPASTSDPNQDPVKAAYNLYQQAQGLSSAQTAAWGQVALLFAARGTANFSIGGYNGQTVVWDSTQQNPGFNFWSQTPNIGHSYLRKSISDADMAALLNPLVQSSSNMPILRSMSPTTVPVGIAQTLTLTGTNFFSDSQVSLNGISHPAAFVSGTQLSVQLSSGDLAQPGTQAVSVVNSAEGGWQSNAINLSVFATTPTLTSLSPPGAMTGSSPITLTVNGPSFIDSSAIQVNGVTRSTTFVSSTQLTATLTANDLATAGSLSITVTNAASGGGTSAPLAFAVTNPLPSLSSISPTSITAGSSGFTLTVNGGNFVSNSVVRVNGANRTTTFISATQLSAAIPASDLAVGAYLSITVFSPTPGGGSAGPLTFTVNNPLPAISSISPNPVVAAGSSFTLTVNGSGFVSGSVVQFDGSPLPTTFLSATQVKAQVPNTDIVKVGQHTITVFNPAPGGGTSNSASLTVVLLLGQTAGPNIEWLTADLDLRSEPMFRVV